MYRVMQRLRRVVLLCAAAALLCVPAGCQNTQEASEPATSRLPVKYTEWTSYTNGNWINDLAFDQKGKLWAVGPGGAVHWDTKAETYEKYTSEHGLCSNQLSAVAAASDGSVWFGSADNGVCRLKDGVFTTYAKEDGLPSNVVHDVAVAPDGTVWAATHAGAASFDGGAWTEYPEGPGEEIVTAVAVDEDGCVWIGTQAKGLYRYSDNKWTSLNDENPKIEGATEDLALAPDGSVWAANSIGGLIHFKGGKTEIVPVGDTIFSSFDCVNVDNDGNVWASSGPLVTQRKDGEWETHPSVDGLPLGFDAKRIVTGPDGTLWCGGFRGGLSGYKDGEWKTLKTKDWLPDNTVLGTAQAKDGSLFIITETGVTRYDGEKAVSWKLGREPEDIATDADGNVWISIRKDGVYEYDGTKWVHMGPGKDGTLTSYPGFDTDDNVTAGDVKVSGGIPDNAWYAQIMFDRDGVLWGVTDTGGIHRLKDGTWSAYAGFPGDSVAGLCQSPQGVYWFSCMDGLYSSKDLREWKKFDVIKDNRDNVYDIGLTYATPDETCWIGALTGVGRRTATGEGTYFKRGDKTPDDETVCITGEPGGAVWIGTQNLWSMTGGSGACRYDNGTWTAYTADQGLASNAVLDIDVASDGVIWFGTMGGLSKYKKL